MTGAGALAGCASMEEVVEVSICVAPRLLPFHVYHWVSLAEGATGVPGVVVPAA